MSITATRFATHVRTWLLIAGLTGLLIAIGGAIGGGALYLFVALAVGMNVAGYWFSDRAGRQRRQGGCARGDARARGDGGRPRPPRRRSHAAPVPDPVRATERVRHRAQSRSRRRGGDRGAAAPAEQGEGVLAREFGHIKNRDRAFAVTSASASWARC